MFVFRSFHKGDIKNSSRVIVGIDAIMVSVCTICMYVFMCVKFFKIRDICTITTIYRVLM